MMLNTKHQASRPSCFRQENVFHVDPIYACVKHVVSDKKIFFIVFPFGGLHRTQIFEQR